MHLLALCLGVISSAYLGECVITGWTTPLLAAGADVDGGIEYIHEGTTGTLFTFLAITGATSVTGYVIDSQTVTDFFDIGTPANGQLTLKSSNVLDGAASTMSHVVKVVATDNLSAVGTATLTIKILPAQFMYGFACTYITPAAAVGPVITNALSSQGTNTYAFASGNTNTDFAVDADGLVRTAKAITTTSGSNGGFYLVITGADDVGTVSTVTTTLSVCVRDTTCTCSLSGAAHITAGLLGMFAAVIMMLLK